MLQREQIYRDCSLLSIQQPEFGGAMPLYWLLISMMVISCRCQEEELARTLAAVCKMPGSRGSGHVKSAGCQYELLEP